MDTLELIIVIAFLILILGSIAWIFYERYKKDKGIGVRAIQLIAILLLIPSIVILGIKGILGSEGIATLFGTIIGYLFSEISKDKKE